MHAELNPVMKSSRRAERGPATDVAATVTDGDYAAALRLNLSSGREPGLGSAYLLGRSAVNAHRGLIDLVLLHHAALAAALPTDVSDEERRKLIGAAGDFLAESLSPYEMAYRGFLEANAALVGVNATLEGEARRVARLLHDGAGQILFALQLALTELDRALPAHLAPILAEIRGLTQQLDDQLHCHSRELYPVVLEDLGLFSALRQLVEGLDRRSRVVCSFECGVSDRPRAEIEFAVYRAVQEALTNAMKHARAHHVCVRLSRERDWLRCSVADDGIGGVAELSARPTRTGLGLTSIRERMKLVGGTVEIRSAKGQGTEIVLRAPLVETRTPQFRGTR
jgi:signal transduction histidine kinase